MDKKKLIPIVIAVVLLIVAIVLFVKLTQKNKEFETLTITYGKSENKYSKVHVEDIIVVNNVSFWVVSVSKNAVVLASSEELMLKDNKTSEFTFNVGSHEKVCFSENNCAIFSLT